MLSNVTNSIPRNENNVALHYDLFEKDVLLKHNRLFDLVKIDSVAVLTFDFSDLGDDWNHFINGRYSKISLDFKKTILNFFDKYSGNYAYMHSYLIPEKYFNNYADLLGVDTDMIIKVGELCTKPDLDKETFQLLFKNSAVKRTKFEGLKRNISFLK